MIEINDRPRRIAGDPKLIRQLIDLNEEKAARMTDAELETALHNNQAACEDRWEMLEQAKVSYQYPSQAWYVFDRHRNRRRLNAQLAALAVED